MKVLHLLPTVDEAYGGPVAALIEADAAGRQFGIDRTVATLDLPGDPWVGRCPLATVPLGSPAVRRARRALPWLRYGFTPHLVPWLRRNLGGFDRVVVHGLWHYAALAARRVLPGGPVPYFVWPHGMLDPWFRTAHPTKHRCKQAAWWLSEGPLLNGARAVLFTSEGERQAAQDAFRPYRLRGVVAGYGTGEAPQRTPAHDAAFAAAVPGLGRNPYWLFLGRLHPKKGCDLLLEAFAADHGPLAGRHLVLAGPDAEGAGVRLQAEAARLGIADRLHWPGMLRGGAKWGALYGCDAFVLPSHGENFGVAVAEALSCGKPVLLSEKVNIAPTVLAAGAGLVAPDSVAGVGRLLAGFAGLSALERAAMGARARVCFLQNFLAERVQARTLAILNDPEPFL
ncbi:glycosyltransferase [Lichenihabitans sp. Uapishka_5]|uniref:glycosyltransferase n=1 Tax=Lichenihabitans sp. Uapishka_5 TaxID=3037302 RepID=UPI0029E8136E|nr:glycosyltransferase [Lichenihabitans sp. Uapishka_5]MDX7952656.1 glycosyltransferase [Lichenihabitans sp. Uapishka_5]